jgi:hypothetical protein
MPIMNLEIFRGGSAVQSEIPSSNGCKELDPSLTGTRE